MIEENVRIPSDGLNLEGRLSYRSDLRVPEGRVMICPPHPFLGGDMENNVVRQLVKTLTDLPLLVFRFNYRGIGNSESDVDLESAHGEFWEHSTCPAYERKIRRDCRAAFRFLDEGIEPDSPLYLIGYSFGCFPALELLSLNPTIPKSCLISPPLSKWPIGNNFFQVESEKLFVFAPGDFACTEELMIETYDRFPFPKKIVKIPQADHFFVGFEARLAELVAEFLHEKVFPQNP